MTKLIHKLTTKPSEATDIKKDTNFPFAILPKEKVKTLQFNNKAIEKYLPTFGNLRHKYIPYKALLKSIDCIFNFINKFLALSGNMYYYYILS